MSETHESRLREALRYHGNNRAESVAVSIAAEADEDIARLTAKLAALRAERDGLIEAAYREGFQDGFDHGNLSYKYPAEDEAWERSIAAEAARKETP